MYMLYYSEFFDLSPIVCVVCHGRYTDSLIDQLMFNTYDIPEKFGKKVCPPDLLSIIVKRLSDGDDRAGLATARRRVSQQVSFGSHVED
jgi:hypothetical protein